MKINSEGLDLIKKFEGCAFRAYKDLVGIWTIGYGHVLREGDPTEIDKDQAEAMLLSDLEEFEAGVSSLVKVPLNENQFSALVCFAYNLGLGKLAGSTLLRELNAREFDKAKDQFFRWDKAGGRHVFGLYRRRLAEAQLFAKPVS